ncbi:hypothetical protein ACYOEI_11540 [Singulisphaera rosea]
MGLAVGLLLAVLVGDAAVAGSPSQDGTSNTSSQGKAPSGPLVSFEVRYMSVSNSEWRGKFDTRLRPIARGGGTSIWAVDRATFQDLLGTLKQEPHSNILEAPKFKSPASGPVNIANETPIRYVAHLKRTANGPINRATSLKFEPETDEVRDGIQIRISSGRVTEDGLLAHLNVDDTRFVTFHTTTISESLLSHSKDDSSSASLPILEKLHINKGNSRQTLGGQIKIPEVVSCKIDLELLIPRDGFLLMSPGPWTSPSKGIVQERMVALSYTIDPTQSSPTAPTASQTSPSLPPLP